MVLVLFGINALLANCASFGTMLFAERTVQEYIHRGRNHAWVDLFYKGKRVKSFSTNVKCQYWGERLWVEVKIGQEELSVVTKPWCGGNTNCTTQKEGSMALFIPAEGRSFSTSQPVHLRKEYVAGTATHILSTLRGDSFALARLSVRCPVWKGISSAR